MKNHVSGVTEFKAKCLALLDGVGERGDTITITKRGKPIATDEILMADMSDLWECTRRNHV